MQINKDNIRLLRGEIEVALQELSKKHGVKIQLGSAKFSLQNISFKMEVSNIAQVGGGELALTPEALDFQSYAHRYGLKADDLNQTVFLGGRRYKIMGLLTRSSKYPILGERPDGRVFKLPADDVAMALLRSRNLPIREPRDTVEIGADDVGKLPL